MLTLFKRKFSDYQYSQKFFERRSRIITMKLHYYHEAFERRPQHTEGLKISKYALSTQSQFLSSSVLTEDLCASLAHYYHEAALLPQKLYLSTAKNVRSLAIRVCSLSSNVNSQTISTHRSSLNVDRALLP